MRTDEKLMQMAGLLTAGGYDHRELVEVIVSMAAEILRPDKACLFIKTDGGKIRIESGVPRGDHEIGLELCSETGEDFMNEVLAGRDYQLITDFSDPRVEYLLPLVERCGTTSLLAVPLFYEGDPLGILTLDFIGGHMIDEGVLGKVHFLSHVISLALWKEKNRQRDERRERLCLLGENVASISHALAHYAQNIHYSLELARESTVVSGKTRKKRRVCKNKRERNSYLEKALSDTRDMLWYVKEITESSQRRRLNFEPVDINEFLVEVVDSLKRYPLQAIPNFDFEPHRALIDKISMATVFYDLAQNAVNAGATELRISTCIKKAEKVLELVVSNNGAKIEESNKDLIFKPWFTTRREGTGLGLSNARTFIETYHHGKIDVVIRPQTAFIIKLPLE